jgi:gamma-glutamyltranspeptidase / glutathione hydrolase
MPHSLHSARHCVLLVTLCLAACSSTVRTASTPVAARPMPAAVAAAARGMVVSSSGIASEAGRDVLAAGGNAVDAAVATGFALAVTYPGAGNIGGGGFMVIRFPDGRATTIDFREMAPNATTPAMFLDSSGAYSAQLHHRSYRSVGVPGTVAGFALAHMRYGRLHWTGLVDPAVHLADSGFVLPPGLARSLGDFVSRDDSSLAPPTPASVAAFSKSGVPYEAGERMRQPDLARTLARIRDQGRDGFYRGETARLLAAEMGRNGGLITEEDLAAYVAKERAPVRGTYRGYEIISMPPPSSGGIAVVEMLNILEGYDLAAARRDSARYVHLLVEAMRRVFLDRARYLGDPDFTSPPVERLTSKAYAARLRATIVEGRASPSAPGQVADRGESDETTHYSVVDGDGMAVAVTYTLEGLYGLGAVVPGAGFLLNNEMGDFNGKPGVTDTTGLIGTDPNLARPGKRMLSSSSPTILAKDGRLVAVVGSPGGRTIINTVAQLVLNIVDGRMGIQDAVNAPRLHHQWLPDVISIERDGLSPETIAALERMGHRIRIVDRQGRAHSILVDARTGLRYGAPDPRDPDAGAAGQ